MAILPLDDGLELLKGRARFATFAAYAAMLGFAAMLLVDLQRALGTLSFSHPTANDAAWAMLYVAGSLIFYVSVVPVSLWIYRAHANLTAADIDGLEYTPGWSVGWFFVPIANLFKPFGAMRELWNASHHENDGFSRDAPPELTAWWGCFIVGNIVVNISTRIDAIGESGEVAGAVVSLLGLALLAGSAWLLVRIIGRITSAQSSLMAIGRTFA
jgi:hypothetical protein